MLNLNPKKSCKYITGQGWTTVRGRREPLWRLPEDGGAAGRGRRGGEHEAAAGRSRIRLLLLLLLSASK